MNEIFILKFGLFNIKGLIKVFTKYLLYYKLVPIK
jgi:hypothetical protein